MAQVKAKPQTTAKTAAAKATPKNLGRKAKLPAVKAAKASTAAAKTTTPKVLLEVGAFARFNGYRAAVDADEAVFAEGDTIYVIEVDTSDEGTLYSAIHAKDLGEYLENGEDALRGGQVAPAEVSELKGTALEKATETFTPVALIGRLAELMDEENDPIIVAINLNHEIQSSYFWMGGAIATILQRGSYLEENGGEYKGEDAFQEFCQAEFGFKSSKARDLARLYTTYSALEGFDPALLESVGWSKASIAQRFVTAENVEEILALAENTEQRELATTLKTKYVAENVTPSGKAASRATISMSTLSFRLGEDAAETIGLVLQQCMKQRGIESEALAIEAICLEWAQDHVEADTAKKRIASKGAKAAKARAAVEKPAAPEAPAASAPAAKPARSRKKPA